MPEISISGPCWSASPNRWVSSVHGPPTGSCSHQRPLRFGSATSLLILLFEGYPKNQGWGPCGHPARTQYQCIGIMSCLWREYGLLVVAPSSVASRSVRTDLLFSVDPNGPTTTMAIRRPQMKPSYGVGWALQIVAVPLQLITTFLSLFPRLKPPTSLSLSFQVAGVKVFGCHSFVLNRLFHCSFSLAVVILYK